MRKGPARLESARFEETFVAEETIEETIEETKEAEGRLVERAARWVVEKRLQTPAVFLLEMHKPVAPIGSMMMLAAMPFVGPFVGFGAIERLALFAEDRGNVERLIKRIEALSREGEAKAPDVGDTGGEEAQA